MKRNLKIGIHWGIGNIFQKYFSKCSQFNKSISYSPATLLIMSFFIEFCIIISFWNLSILAYSFFNFFYRSLVKISFQRLFHQPAAWLNVNVCRYGCCFSLYKTYCAIEAFIVISQGRNSRSKCPKQLLKQK